MVRILCGAALVLLLPLSAWAEGAVHLFDDLNGDGISDAEQQTAVESEAPSEESVDANQPEDDGQMQ